MEGEEGCAAQNPFAGSTTCAFCHRRRSARSFLVQRETQDAERRPLDRQDGVHLAVGWEALRRRWPVTITSRLRGREGDIHRQLVDMGVPI